MKTLPLSTGGVTLIDDEDYDYLSKWTWRAMKSGHVYRVTRDKPKNGQYGKMITILMHRVVMGAINGQIVDHSNRIPADNRKVNLRFCSHRQNMRNQKLSKRNTSGYKGVYKAGKNWRAVIVLDGKDTHLGVYATPVQAAVAFNERAMRIDPEYYCLNIF